MSAKYKEQWKPRMIRMSDELWQGVMEQAKLQDICAAEFVRLLLQKELDMSDSEVIYKGEVIGMYTKGLKKSKNEYTSSTKSVKNEQPLPALPGKYGCGCPRGEKKLCPKHHRM